MIAQYVYEHYKLSYYDKLIIDLQKIFKNQI